MKASMTAVLLCFVLGVSNGRSRFSNSEVNDVDVDAENVTSLDHVKNQPFTENFINSFSDISCIFSVRKSLFKYHENFGEKAY
ncbi:hypothetical protein P5673_027583 [Acropora cervicornis]|uniref:Uncharacterized protein n=1 Tax=Acropora cervicornis TaxID=6130 RepID=A0AAD9UVZ1_ACRCE|nr:hypothetical protein P5673_027583 [Acropora cervicornis]